MPVTTEASSWELSPGFPHEWQRSKYLSRHMLPPRVHFARKLTLRVKPGLEPRHLGVSCNILTATPNTCSGVQFLKRLKNSSRIGTGLIKGTKCQLRLSKSDEAGLGAQPVRLPLAIPACSFHSWLLCF